jgi:hypothetical protein
MPEAYVIRYSTRTGDENPALIVTDQQGNAYLYASGALQLRAADDPMGERLISLLGTSERWESQQQPELYSLDALRHVGAAPRRKRPVGS